ncbi:MAG: DUF2975 domain-containing protein [Alphaproteobacteria bacterium]|nr:DUF2975 domain-containing protein [Alphaproteobacteria bacterium]
MAWLALAGAVIDVAAVLAAFLFPDTMNAIHAFEYRHNGMEVTSAMPLSDRLAALVFACVPLALAVWSLIALSRLFGFYARAEVFSEGALRSLWVVAVTMFWNVITAFFMQAPISYFLSGHHEISLGLSSDDFAAVFMAGVILVIARVMGEARRMADENASFV